MNVVSGTRLGPYEINERLGAGGMGEVWRATDTRLDRSVAVKILPAEFAENAQLRLRFEREAKAISQLNHPHICTLHDIGVDRGVHYLVMELLEGESLADRLSRGALPLDQVLRYSVEIASALDRAHREGIIHRDLKPANIVLTKSGAKLLDFGLAKSALSSPSTDVTIDGATQARPLTQEGTIVGTYQYMAPEQVSGEAVDRRSDIFAFGAVLYEMITATPAFRGKNRTSIIAAIISGEPQPLSTLQPLTPPALERVVKTCLAKDPDDRWQTAHDVMLELKWIQEGGSQAGVAAPLVHRRKTRERFAWSVAAVATLVALVLGVMAYQAAHKPAPVLRMSIAAPPDAAFNIDGENCGSLTISPDGRYVTFLAAGADGKRTLWLRPLDGETHPIPGTEGALFPFWSADSRFIAFFADTKLKKVALTGTPPLSICDAQNPRGGAWNRDGTILFSPAPLGPIFRVSASGGVATPATKLDTSAGETTHRWATFLPDGKHFLYLAGTHGAGTKSETNAVYVDSIEHPGRKLLFRARSNVAYAEGYLIYARDRTLVAQPFDLGKLELSGDPVPLAQDVTSVSGFFRTVFAVSQQGTLVYQRGVGDAKLIVHFYDRTGKQLEQAGDADFYQDVIISPDGKRLAMSILDPASGIISIWLHDLQRNVRTKFAFGPTDHAQPVWSWDGSRLAYGVTAAGGVQDLYYKDVSGTGTETLIWHDAAVKNAVGFSPDGKSLLFNSLSFNAKNRNDIWVVPVIPGSKATPLFATAANETNGSFSPDGKWIVYTSDESGRAEVYVTPYPTLNAKWQVSTNGGAYGDWSSDGKEIWYATDDGTVLNVPVATNAGSVTLGTATPLFNAGVTSIGSNTPDHTRIVLAKPNVAATVINVVTNWPATIHK